MNDNCEIPKTTINDAPHINKEITNDKNTDQTSFPFKKPLLVGKIGRLPKKLKSTQLSEAAPQLISNDSTKIKIEEDSKPEISSQKVDAVSLQYKEPVWSGLPKSKSKIYNFEVLKDGSIIDTVNLMDKSFWVFGRLANCDISMQHPTISRYHAILQYRSEPDEKNEAGFYVYDLGSTHGTFLNKNRLRSRVYVRIQVGHILKLGCSSRNYLLNGPEEDSEEESDLTVTELKQKRKEELERKEKERVEAIERINKEDEDRRKKEEERGIDWGLGEDADEETDISENPYAQSNNEDLYLDDPKKTLRGFFEREGLNLEYECTEQGMGQFLCKVELPVDDEKGRPIYAEIIHKGKKKEAVIQCALEACRILDRYGLLRQAVHESRKRKAKDWAENDYYDSDDDTFLDRTGEIEKKREKRMNSKNPKKAETYESLMEKEREIAESINALEKQLSEAQNKAKISNKSSSEEDPLDAFMKDLKDSKPDKSTISKLRNELGKLKQEHAKVIKLVNIAKPASLPPLVSRYNSEASSQSSKSKFLPLFGKRKKVPVVVSQKPINSDSTSVDDDEEDEIEEMKLDVTEKQSTEDNEGIVEPQIMEKLEKKTIFGLQKSEETSDHKVNSYASSKRSSEVKCEDAINSLLNKVKFIYEKIELLPELGTREQKSSYLLSTVTGGIGKILEDLKDIEVEKCEKIENSCEVSKDLGVMAAKEVLKKNKNQRRIQQRQEKAEIEKNKGYAEDAKKEDYNMWVPPKDQSGDGRTKLNEKFGY